MKPEPLKGKWYRKSDHYLYMKYGLEMEKSMTVSQDCIELWDDVKSAVEWLKQAIEGRQNEIGLRIAELEDFAEQEGRHPHLVRIGRERLNELKQVISSITLLLARVWAQSCSIILRRQHLQGVSGAF